MITNKDILDSIIAPSNLSKEFKTDTLISAGKTHPTSARKLEKWVPDSEFTDLPNDTNDVQGWDQFAANEKKFGITTDYKDEIYTTILDKSGNDFKKREQDAARIAKEIESKATNNPHVAQERGQRVSGDDDEETVYSSVTRPGHDSNSKSRINPQRLSTMSPQVAQALAKRAEMDKHSRSNNLDGRKLPNSINPPLEELKHHFKKFGGDFKKGIALRHLKHSSENRKDIFADLKKFSTDFQIPSVLKPAKVEDANVKADVSKPNTKQSPVREKKSPEREARMQKRSNSKPRDSSKSPAKQSKSKSPTKQESSSQEAKTKQESKPKSTFKLSVQATEFTPSYAMPPVIPPGGNQPCSTRLTRL